MFVQTLFSTKYFVLKFAISRKSDKNTSVTCLCKRESKLLPRRVLNERVRKCRKAEGNNLLGSSTVPRGDSSDLPIKA